MCLTCGCGQSQDGLPHAPEGHDHDGHTHGGHDHDGPDGGGWHTHDGEHWHTHDGHAHDEAADRQRRLITVETELLARNDAQAARNRALLASHEVFAVNLLSSPGSGKTSLLVRTIELLAGAVPVAVVEGDQQTDNDARRIAATGVPALQINTGKGCHLDADMLARAMTRLDLPRGGILFVENVGNLVCPAAFDLGEACKVVVFSVTEGEDKPLKYPDMFRAADLVLLNKVDLLPHLDLDVDLAVAHTHRIAAGAPVLSVSARTGEGMPAWLDWLRGRAAALAAGRPS